MLFYVLQLEDWADNRDSLKKMFSLWIFSPLLAHFQLPHCGSQTRMRKEEGWVASLSHKTQAATEMWTREHQGSFILKKAPSTQCEKMSIKSFWKLQEENPSFN